MKNYKTKIIKQSFLFLIENRSRDYNIIFIDKKSYDI